MTLRGTDVPAMMRRVEATLEIAEASPEGASGVLRIAPEGDREINVARMRRRADIETRFHSGSDRRAVGGVIRLAKRVVRRSLRWYLEPMMSQQSRFNHATLDAIEQLRLRVNRLALEVERLRDERE